MLFGFLTVVKGTDMQANIDSSGELLVSKTQGPGAGSWQLRSVELKNRQQCKLLLLAKLTHLLGIQPIISGGK